MKMRRPRTLLGMVLVGLAFVTVPLLIAVGNAVVKLGQLAAESAAVLSDSAAATIENQKIATLLLNMERNGRQYVALKDVASASSLLPLYDGDQADFEMRVALLRSLPMSYEISAALEQLATASKEVHRMLHGSPAESSEDAIVERFRSMTTSARDVAQRMRTLIDTRLSSLQENAGAAQRSIAWQSAALIPGTLALIVLFLLLPLAADRYVTVLATDIVCFALFAVSLHFIMGPAGMVSFGHAAYFGLGAYAAALLFKKAGLPMEVALVLAPFCAGLFAVVYGWFCVRLSGVYLAMLTLAFAQISWSIVFQWDEFTSGSNGIVGVWPSAWLADKSLYYYMTFALCGAGIAFLWRVLFSPFGYVLRAGRDSPLRAEAIGIDVRRFQWMAFVLAGSLAGLAGAVFAFSKGSISPSAVSIGLSTDALVMVLLGGLETLTGPVVGAAIFTWLRDTLARETDFWRAVLGLVILVIVLLFPQGLVGGLKALLARARSA